MISKETKVRHKHVIDGAASNKNIRQLMNQKYLKKFKTNANFALYFRYKIKILCFVSIHFRNNCRRNGEHLSFGWTHNSFYNGKFRIISNTEHRKITKNILQVSAGPAPSDNQEDWYENLVSTILKFTLEAEQSARYPAFSKEVNSTATSCYLRANALAREASLSEEENAKLKEKYKTFCVDFPNKFQKAIESGQTSDEIPETAAIGVNAFCNQLIAKAQKS